MSNTVKTIRTEAHARTWLADNGIELPADTYERDGVTYIRESASCTRCGGSGWGPWFQDGGRCYGCGGADTRNRTVSVSVKRYAQRLKAAYRKAEKAEAEAAARAELREERLLEGQRDWCERNGYGRITFEERDAQREAERQARAATAGHVGTVGERREFTAVIKAIPSWDGYRLHSTTYCHIMEDADGNTLVWKTTDNGFRTGEHQPIFAEVGDTVTFVATVKEHGERHGEKQTVVTRAKTVSVARAEAA